MSKRGMEFQGGGDRFGAQDQEERGGDAPRTATAAQMARRKIASLKGRPGSQRGSRQASPAVGPVNAFNPQQTFQPPQTGSFNFAFAGNNNSNDTPTFGQQPPSQPQQNGGFSFGASTSVQPSMPAQPPGAGLFGSQNTNSTTSFNNNSFGSNNNQPQQNGFAPATSSIFSTQNTTTTASTNPFSFGQTPSEKPAQLNGAGSAPSTSFGAQANGSNGFSFGASKPTTEDNRGTTPSFTGFGTSQQGQKDNTPSFAGFGASQPAAQTPKSTTPAFGGFAGQQSSQASSTAQPASSMFNGFGKSADKPTDTNGEKPKALFSFGATTAPAEPTNVKPGESIFSGLAQPNIKPGMFTQSSQNGDATPKASNLFNFSASNNNSVTPASATTTSNLFNFGQSTQANATQEDANATGTRDTNGQQSQKPQDSPVKFTSTQAETPKAPTNIFQGFGRPQPSATPAVTFGLSEDTSMQSPENTPKKPNESQGQTVSNMFSGFSNTRAPALSAEKTSDPTASSADKPRSMFDRLEKRAEVSDTPKPTFSFGINAATPIQESRSITPQTERPLSKSAQQSTVPATEPRPSASLFPGTQPSTLSAFKPIPAAPVTNAKSTPTTTSTSTVSAAHRNNFKTVNAGFLHALKGAGPDLDWSSLALSYLTEITKLRQRDVSMVAKVSTTTPPDRDVTPKAPAFTNIFQSQTPSNNIFKAQPTQPPATAPVSKKRPADEDLTKSLEAPTTEKRARAEEPIEYPKLSENASKSARLFESVLDKAPSATPKFGPPDDIVNKVREDAAKKADGGKSMGFAPATTSLFSDGFKPSASQVETTSSTKTKATFGFTPLAPTFTTEASSEAPKTVSAISPSPSQAATRPAEAAKFGFTPSSTSSSTAALPAGMPTFSAPATGASGFLSAFGKKAEANAEEEKKKRKAEDYDSEEDDEAEWEAKYEAEQLEKKRKIEAATKSSSAFGFKPATTESTTKTSTGAFSFGQRKNASAEAEPKKVSAEELEKQNGTGDKTWQPKTPIKFGTSLNARDSTTPAAAPPANPFGGLFGSGSQTPATNKPDTAKLASSSLGFSFAPKTPTLGAPRATTPPDGTSGGETSTAGEGEPSDTLNDKQVEDMTALLPEERAENDVLFEVAICKASKFMPKQTEDGKTAMAWVERGKGPLYILRNKSSGKTTVLLKVPPLGKVAMNFLLLGGNAEYKLAQGRTKHISGPFVDHLDGNAKKPSSWLMQVGKPEDAKEMARLMQENRPTE